MAKDNNGRGSGVGMAQSTMDTLSLRTQWPRVRFSAFPKIYSLDVAEFNRQQHCLVLSGQKHNNVDRTHLVLLDSATKKFRGLD